MTTPVAVTVSVDPEIKRLLSLTAVTLASADLDEALEDVAARLGHQAERLTELESVDGSTGSMRLRFRPYVELALLETQAIARSTGTRAMKTARIRQMLVLAGY